MVHICEIFAAEYDIKFNEENTVAIIFYCLAMVNHQCHLELDGQPVTWVREVKHLGSIVTSHITDARDCTRKRYFFLSAL